VGHALLLVAAGPVTAIPLLLFAAGARRLPLATLGVLQYINPTLQFLWGVVVAGEPMPVSRWVGVGLVWAALVIFTADALRARERNGSP
jgi:chloramphenicol-sensitive protein RarD